MTRTPAIVFSLVASLCFFAPAVARDLTFAERVNAQETIERQYYMHTIDPTRSFEEAVSREALQRSVRRYLRESVALERFWNTPVTAAMLDREMRRIAASTMLPDRLQQLHDALGNDPVVIRECLVRPVLVRRLLGNFYDGDPAMHRVSRTAAEALRARLVEGTTATADADPPDLPSPATSILEIALSDGSEDPVAKSPVTSKNQTLRVSEDEFDRWVARAPGTVGDVGAVIEERERFIVRKLLSRDVHAITLETYTVSKRSFDSWWREVETDLDFRDVSTVGGDSGVPLDPAGCFTAFTWNGGALDDALPARYNHVSVWTGSYMLVWGGVPDEGSSTVGNSYDPLTDIWDRMAPAPQPLDAGQSRAVWTGEVMLVWGGPDVAGLSYDPLADAWTSMATLDAPEARSFYTANWSGTEMIVWGGVSPSEGLINTGARYDPSTDVWTAMSTVGAPSPRQEHTAVWTGDQLLVWGGIDTAVLSTGAKYDPATDAWSAVSDTAAPQARFKHRSVWTGTEMLVWGGGDFEGGSLDVFDTGGRYDPMTDSWSATSLTSAALARWDHTALWTGTEMIVWGGGDEMGPVNGGGRYSPSTDSWQPSGSPSLDPVSRLSHTAIWTGGEMIVWGGALPLPFVNLRSGGRYDPLTDQWTPTSLGIGPTPRTGHTAVWTGNEMVVWGGGPSDSGGRYDPTLDDWRRITTVGAPSAREGHVAVLAGGEMVVWGGSDTNTGGRYDPVTDSWQPTSVVGAPSVRTGATAVTTGSEMIVWGGSDGAEFLDDGASYDPALDTWSPMATSGAPGARTGHTSVWTGTEMIVWGGQGPGSMSSGGAYYPAADGWVPTNPSGAADARFGHTAVWTGEEMIVSGGNCTFGVCTTGGLYDPIAGTWTSINPSGGLARQNHTAVWTGSRMIVWGGSAGCCDAQDTGGQYDPEADLFITTTLNDAPSARRQHTAVWADGFVIIWGGESGAGEPLGDGSRLSVDNDQEGSADRCDSCTDIDQDGFGDPGFPENTCTTDNCPSVPNSMQLDGDGDGYGDACDPCLDDPGPDPDVDGCSTLDNCPEVFNPGQTDQDADALGDACDSCPVGERVFLQTIRASGPSAIVWGHAVSVAFVRGELASVASYAVFDSGTLAGATSLDISADDVPGGSYYLIRRSEACTTWQTSSGAEPGRDVTLP